MSATPIQIDRGLDLFEITGADSTGARAAFDIILISEGVTWPKGSDQLSRRESGLSGRDLLELLRARLDGATDIIAVGTASSEGSRTEEEYRALNRGAKLAGMAADVVRHEVRLWVLNLGQHTKPCFNCAAHETRHQRPVILIGVIAKEHNDVNIGEALRMAFDRSDNLPKLNEFSQFDLIQAR